MATVTWLDPLLVQRTVECLTLEEAYDYEAALECSGVATNVHVIDPAWELLMDAKMEEASAWDDGSGLQELMDHMHFDHGSHVRVAESRYWEQDHASHVMKYFDVMLPF